MAERKWTRIGLTMGAVLLGSLFIGGCSNNKMVTERNQLIMQNKQLQQQLAETKASLAATRTQLQQQQEIAAAASAQAAANQQKMATTAPANNSGYSTILPPMSSGSGQSTQSMQGMHRMRSRHTRRVEMHRFVLSSDLLFAPGSARLSPRATHMLMHVAYELRSRYAGRHVLVEGYTDNTPIHHPYPNNYYLGLARARSVESFLARHGVSRRRMRAISFGDHHMVSHTDLALDRRVEVVVLR
ncbi:MAG: OmpA family protein [Phycisphaerae bacterium]